MIDVDELQDRRSKCRIDLHCPFEVLARLIAAAQFCQDLRVGVVECALIGRALQQCRQCLFGIGRAAGRQKNLRDRHAGPDVIGIEPERSLQVGERFVDLCAVVRRSIEEQASQDALRIVEIGMGGSDFAKCSFGGVGT